MELEYKRMCVCVCVYTKRLQTEMHTKRWASRKHTSNTQHVCGFDFTSHSLQLFFFLVQPLAGSAPYTLFWVGFCLRGEKTKELAAICQACWSALINSVNQMRAGMDRCGIFRGITAGKLERVTVCKPEKDIHARMPVVGLGWKYHLISPAPSGHGPLPNQAAVLCSPFGGHLSVHQTVLAPWAWKEKRWDGNSFELLNMLPVIPDLVNSQNERWACS